MCSYGWEAGVPKQLLLSTACALALLVWCPSLKETCDSALEPLCLTKRAGISMSLSFLKRQAILALTNKLFSCPRLGGSWGGQLRLQSCLKLRAVSYGAMENISTCLPSSSCVGIMLPFTSTGTEILSAVLYYWQNILIPSDQWPDTVIIFPLISQGKNDSLTFQLLIFHWS